MRYDSFTVVIILNIAGRTVGIVVDSSSSAAVSGNDVCGDRRSLSTAESASPPPIQTFPFVSVTT